MHDRGYDWRLDWELASYPWCCGDCTEKMNPKNSEYIMRIDAKKALTALPADLDAETVQRCIEAMNNPKAADVEPKQRWIPVTERLPEKSGLYLCYTEFKIFAVLHFSRKHKLFNWFDEMNPGEINSDIKCIAWMPLPEPPKGEDDAEVH